MRGAYSTTGLSAISGCELQRFGYNRKEIEFFDTSANQ
jgi:hypothetical protein